MTSHEASPTSDDVQAAVRRLQWRTTILALADAMRWALSVTIAIGAGVPPYAAVAGVLWFEIIIFERESSPTLTIPPSPTALPEPASTLLDLVLGLGVAVTWPLSVPLLLWYGWRLRRAPASPTTARPEGGSSAQLRRVR